MSPRRAGVGNRVTAGEPVVSLGGSGTGTTRLLTTSTAAGAVRRVRDITTAVVNSCKLRSALPTEAVSAGRSATVQGGRCGGDPLAVRAHRHLDSGRRAAASPAAQVPSAGTIVGKPVVHELAEATDSEQLSRIVGDSGVRSVGGPAGEREDNAPDPAPPGAATALLLVRPDGGRYFEADAPPVTPWPAGAAVDERPVPTLDGYDELLRVRA